MKHTAPPLLIILLLTSCAGAPGPKTSPVQEEVPLPTPPPPPFDSTPVQGLPFGPEGPQALSGRAPQGLERQGKPPPTAQKRTIAVTSENWSFTPALITVKQGEVVELQLKGISGTHGFAVPALGINVPVAPDEVKTVTLPTHTPGTYTFFCSIPCGSGHRDMRGTVVIEP